MVDKQAVDMLLNKESEISNKFHQAISQILRVGYETERGKQTITDLIDSVQYTLEEIERIINRQFETQVLWENVLLTFMSGTQEDNMFYYRDLNDKPIKRNPIDYPYQYDSYVIWKENCNPNKSQVVYSDRLFM